MLRIRFDTEDWREHLIDDISDLEWELDVDQDASNYDDVADAFCCATLDLLAHRDIDYERAYQQSVGTNVLLQRGGSEAEREAFDSAMEGAREEIQPLLREQAASGLDI